MRRASYRLVVVASLALLTQACKTQNPDASATLDVAAAPAAAASGGAQVVAMDGEDAKLTIKIGARTPRLGEYVRMLEAADAAGETEVVRNFKLVAFRESPTEQEPMPEAGARQIIDEVLKAMGREGESREQTLSGSLALTWDASDRGLLQRVCDDLNRLVVSRVSTGEARSGNGDPEQKGVCVNFIQQSSAERTADCDPGNRWSKCCDVGYTRKQCLDEGAIRGENDGLDRVRGPYNNFRFFPGETSCTSAQVPREIQL